MLYARGSRIIAPVSRNRRSGWRERNEKRAKHPVKELCLLQAGQPGKVCWGNEAGMNLEGELQLLLAKSGQARMCVHMFCVCARACVCAHTCVEAS